jgi:two-component system, NarL family, sensor histidine kinase UhpB
MENKLKILHLEDMPFDVEMVERELIKGNIEFEILVVDNKTDFEKALDNFLPDIILSDHSLPSFDSAGALELTKNKAPGIPFILVTATVSEEFAVNILKRGASDYILKTNLKRLPAAVQNAIEKSKIILEKEKAEKELEHSYIQVRKLAAHLQDVREKERASIAREIHDELGQLLTALKLDILWLGLKLKEPGTELNKKVKVMEKLVSSALITVRKIATELHPALLDKLGLIEAIKWQSREFEKRTGVKIKLTLPSEQIDISNSTAITLFRIYQESLTNVARHAAATMVYCTLQKNNEELELIVTDDGKGFDVSYIEQMQSLGLLSMKERAVMIGGKYEIVSELKKGTKVQVVLPFNN